jgi:hypothetical protein
LNNLNIVDPEILWYCGTWGMYTAVPPIDPYTFWTAEALDQQSKERIITGAGLACAAW